MLTIDATDPKSGTAEFKATAIRIDKLSAEELDAHLAAKAPGTAAAERCGGTAAERAQANPSAPDQAETLPRGPSPPDRTPTDDERDAVDALLGAPESGWEGGARRDVDGHMARGGTRRATAAPAAARRCTRCSRASAGSARAA